MGTGPRVRTDWLCSAGAGHGRGKLAEDPTLRRYVEDKDASMRVPHETVYTSLYVQT
jgi:hypothetical protein